MPLRNENLVILCALFAIGCGDKTASKDDSINSVFEKTTERKPVFEKIRSEQSNLVFSNTITENISTLENLFNFDYFYNGAGVGLEDINNDGLLDVFFSANQEGNKLSSMKAI